MIPTRTKVTRIRIDILGRPKELVDTCPIKQRGPPAPIDDIMFEINCERETQLLGFHSANILAIIGLRRLIVVKSPETKGCLPGRSGGYLKDQYWIHDDLLLLDGTIEIVRFRPATHSSTTVLIAFRCANMMLAPYMLFLSPQWAR